MKLTSFIPQIISKDAQSTIALFEALGFQRVHNKVNEGDLAFSVVCMKDANGNHVDVAEASSAPFPQDMMAIRMNVDDFDAARELLLQNGFRESKNFGVHYTSSSKYAYFVSPSGFLIDLVFHIKNHD